MTPRVLVFQHAAYCPPAMLGDCLAADGVETAVVQFDRGDAIPNLEDFDVLMVMGGGMDVWEEDQNPWLVREKAAIRRWVADLDKPFLGICLGHQLLAEALGGKVGRARAPEVALLDIGLTAEGRRSPLFAGFPGKKRVLQWHGAEVTAPPKGAVVLAASAECPVSAFGVGSAAFGIQYHVEATDTSVRDWIANPAGAGLLERAQGPGAASRFQGEVARAMPELRANARRFHDNFMEIARRRLAGEAARTGVPRSRGSI